MLTNQLPGAGGGVASRADFEALIVELSSRFVGLRAHDVDDQIEDALSRACGVLDVDLAVLWQSSPGEPGELIATHMVYLQPHLQPRDGFQASHFPWTRAEICAGRMVAIASLSELPPAADVDRESCRRLGVKSRLCLPLAVGGEPPFGFLSFNTLRAERAWPEPQARRFKVVAQLFTNALARRRHELSLRESSERLSLAADAAEAGLWTLDFHTGVFWLTERAQSLFGFPPRTGVSLDQLESCSHPDDRDLLRPALKRSLRERAAFYVEYRLVIQGERRARWLAMRGRPHSTGGDSQCLMGAVIDVTARKRGEVALRKSEARLDAGADLAGLAFYEVNHVDQSAFVDERFKDLCGLPPEQDGGVEAVAFWKEHLHPGDRARVLGLRERMFDGGTEHLSTEYRYLHPTRGEVWLHHAARVALRDSAGRTLQTYGALRDITEQRKREEALQESHAEITRLKDRLQAESDYLKAEIRGARPHAGVVGKGPAIQKVLHLARQVASTDSSVLIHGETGTGKELIAQAIHRDSARRSHLMVNLNCAALPSGLVESELFGRERGAFTGAMTRQIGRFELADRSTLFLDEVGELSLEVQAKLLRVLETGEFERLGTPRTSRADVRLIAATNRDLADDVRKGRFREDLYYRLNVFPIRVPALRERPEDIPLLVWAFLEEFSTRMGKKITQVPRKTMEALQRHRWPGNVRELRNVIEHGAILTSDDTLRVELVGDVVSAPAAAPPPALADAERELILRTLEGAAWRIKGPRGAASSLGINPSTLYSRMKKLGIQLPGRMRTESK
jgi:formate hydrogenlyase transcriptional activator